MTFEMKEELKIYGDKIKSFTNPARAAQQNPFRSDSRKKMSEINLLEKVIKSKHQIDIGFSKKNFSVS